MSENLTNQQPKTAGGEPISSSAGLGRTSAQFAKDLRRWRDAQGTPEAYYTVNPFDPSGE